MCVECREIQTDGQDLGATLDALRHPAPVVVRQTRQELRQTRHEVASMELRVEDDGLGRQAGQHVREAEVRVELLVGRQRITELILVHVEQNGSGPQHRCQKRAKVRHVDEVGAEQKVVIAGRGRSVVERPGEVQRRASHAPLPKTRRQREQLHVVGAERPQTFEEGAV